MPKFASALGLPEQASPGNPPSGWIAIFAKSGGALWVRNSSGVERLVEPGILFPFSKSGTLAVATGTFKLYNDCGATLTIKSVRASVGTAPTGAGSSVTVDVNINGTTSIFSTRPVIPAGSITSGKVTTLSTTTISDGSYFTVDIDTVGSTTPGSDLVVQILC